MLKFEQLGSTIRHRCLPSIVVVVSYLQHYALLNSNTSFTYHIMFF